MLHRLGLWTRRWPRALGLALLPSACALCGAACEAPVCAPCQRQFIVPGQARCPVCANPLDAAPACAEPADLNEADGRAGGVQRPERINMHDGAGALARCAAPHDDVARLARAAAGDAVRHAGNRSDAPRRCGACLAQPPAFDATLVAADYTRPLDQLVLALKFGARLGLAPWFARMLRDSVLEHPDFGLPNLLCPVPLGPRRLAERGFNQALEIARPLARELGIPLRPRLAIRPRDTRAQSSLAPGERGANLRHAFVVAPDALALVRDQHIGVVDDVMTSGHTLDELAAMFKRFGAARVTNLVFARTPPH
jgi:ComF family protein